MNESTTMDAAPRTRIVATGRVARSAHVVSWVLIVWWVLAADTARASSYAELALPPSGLTTPLMSMLPGLATQRPADLGGVPFTWSGSPVRVFSSQDLVPELDVPADVAAPLVVHLLIGSRLTAARYATQRVGTVRLGFDDGAAQSIPLVIGENVREWRPLEGASATVNTVSDRHILEVHRETLQATLFGRLDKLAVTIDQTHRGKRLVSVQIRDELAGITAPNLVVAAISVERIPRLITFMRDGEVWLAETDGAAARRLTIGCQDCDHPSLAPGAQRVVFVGRDPGAGNLAVRVVGTSGMDTPRTIQDLGPDGVTTRPRFTDDGSRVLFHKRRAPGRAADVFALGLTDGVLKQMTTTSARDETNPAPAPDNGDVIYVSRGRVYRRDGRTGKRKVIVRPSRTLSRPDEPTFSPDGTTIVFRAHPCRSKEPCGAELFTVPRTGGVPTPVTSGFGDIASPAFLDDGATVIAASRGAAWSIRVADGRGELTVENATSPGAESGDGIECLQPAQAIVCYHRYRTRQATALLSRPDPAGEPIGPGTVGANVTIGVQSTILPDGCPTGPVPTAGERTSGAFRWGYVDAPNNTAHGTFAWIAAADLEPAFATGELCGPEETDFQCNVGPRACAASRCNGPLPTVSPDDVGTETSCNAGTDERVVYAAPDVLPFFPGGPSIPLGAPLAHLTSDTGDHFKELWRFSTIGWHCVEFVRSHGEPPQYGWIRDAPSRPGWCGDPTCGDGEKNLSTEECDDFNDDPCDECTPQCKKPDCPDGYFCPGKDDRPGFSPAECDEGPSSETCTSLCRKPFCGDGLLNYQIVNEVRVTDQCEDENSNVNDACIGCQNAKCGDGYVRMDLEPDTGLPYEDCEPGQVRGDGVPCDSVDHKCRWKECGNGFLQSGEECEFDRKRGVWPTCGNGRPCVACECEQDADGDTWTLPSDCNDADPNIHPYAWDPCEDGVDQDCSGSDCQYWHDCTVHCSTESLTSVLRGGVYGQNDAYCIQWAQAQCRAQPWQDAWRAFLDGRQLNYAGTRLCCAKCRNRTDAYNMNVSGNCAAAASSWCNQSGRGGLDPNTPWYNPGAFWGACRNP